MAKSSASGNDASQSDLWAQSFELWRKACSGQAQPDMQQAMNKCLDMGKEYFAMAEQISKGMTEGANPIEAINQWLEQMKQSLQQFGSMPGFNGSGVNDFMKQWFAPNASWQEMVAGLTPMNQAFWQMPGMNTSVFNLGFPRTTGETAERSAAGARIPGSQLQIQPGFPARGDGVDPGISEPTAWP
jgi:hypothetical protein